ncbi:MAG: dUTP diphosphatase [Nostocoides sp.]
MASAPLLRIHRLHPDAVTPTYAHDGDAGADLYAVEAVTLAPGERRLVGTGIAMAIPTGWVGLVHPRSGLAHQHGIGIVNAPGTIDAGYRGEVRVNLINHDPAQAFTVCRGDRIAQLVLQQVGRARFEVVAELPSSDRGDNGHGSSGGFGSPGPAVEKAEA